MRHMSALTNMKRRKQTCSSDAKAPSKALQPSTTRLTCMASRFPKNCSTGRIWLLSSSGKMPPPHTPPPSLPPPISSSSPFSRRQLTLQPPPAAGLLPPPSSSSSSFSLPSCGSGEAEQRVLSGPHWHSQTMRDTVADGDAAIAAGLRLNIFGSALSNFCRLRPGFSLLLPVEACGKRRCGGRFSVRLPPESSSMLGSI
ncbi:hypothetical protein CRUP_008095 [Coryphaenoides rupestris]|nr:hypothetical protein CRUP_008095 [Coryphaenoides rupestris]